MFGRQDVLFGRARLSTTGAMIFVLEKPSTWKFFRTCTLYDCFQPVSPMGWEECAKRVTSGSGRNCAGGWSTCLKCSVCRGGCSVNLDRSSFRTIRIIEALTQHWEHGKINTHKKNVGELLGKYLIGLNY